MKGLLYLCNIKTNPTEIVEFTCVRVIFVAGLLNLLTEAVGVESRQTVSFCDIK